MAYDETDDLVNELRQTAAALRECADARETFGDRGAAQDLRRAAGKAMRLANRLRMPSDDIRRATA